jgi:hypothetical protein
MTNFWKMSDQSAVFQVLRDQKYHTIVLVVRCRHPAARRRIAEDETEEAASSLLIIGHLMMLDRSLLTLNGH